MQKSKRILNTILSSGRKSTKQETEDNRIEYEEKIFTPRVRTKDLGNGFVQVVMVIPGLQPTKHRYAPIGGTISVDVCNKHKDFEGFDMRAEFVDEKKKVKTIYKFGVRRFPSRVTKSEWEVKKGEIIMTLEKHPDDRNINWVPAVLLRGLDHLSSSSSDDD